MTFRDGCECSSIGDDISDEFQYDNINLVWAHRYEPNRTILKLWKFHMPHKVEVEIDGKTSCLIKASVGPRCKCRVPVDHM